MPCAEQPVNNGVDGRSWAVKSASEKRMARRAYLAAVLTSSSPEFRRNEPTQVPVPVPDIREDIGLEEDALETVILKCLRDYLERRWMTVVRLCCRKTNFRIWNKVCFVNDTKNPPNQVGQVRNMWRKNAWSRKGGGC